MNAPTGSAIRERTIIDSLGDGIYATDLERNIVYWSRSAERITGWTQEDVRGRGCWDNFLCHVDKDGRSLCGKDACPMHRAIVTNEGSTVPIIVFATGKDGGRIPMQVSVAPIHDDEGRVIGAVEVFRDMTAVMDDITRAQRIQQQAMSAELPQDPRATFAVHYTPQDIIGGDFYLVERLDADRIAFMLADLMGHGTSAALHTMYLRSLWEELRELRMEPAAFVGALNNRLHRLVRESHSFATALYGVLDLETGRLRLVPAGHGSPFVFRAAGGLERIETMAMALGLIDEFPYPVAELELRRGDCVLAFTDGAFELRNRLGELLLEEGFERLLHDMGYPAAGITLPRIEAQLLELSDSVRFEDDLTLMELRFAGKV